MPLKTPLQIGSIAEYKKLIRTDAAALSATGAKFHYFSKFTFPDKTVTPVIFFGAIPPTCTAAVKAGGTGPASGQATVNDADEIELEVGNGAVAYGGLAKALKGFGVLRTLKIPQGALENEQGGNNGPTGNNPTLPTTNGPKPTVPRTAPLLGRRPGVTPPQNPQGPRPMPNVPTTPVTNNPTTQQRPVPRPQPTPTTTGNNPTTPPTVPVRRPLVKPTSTPPQQTTTTPPNPNPGNPGTTPPLQRRPLVKPGTQNPGTGPTQGGGNNPQTNPQQPKPQSQTTPPTTKPPTPNPGTTGQNKPTTQPPTNQPPITPPSTPEKLFRGRLTGLKSTYDGVTQGNTNGHLKPLFVNMLSKAKGGDFPGALVDAGKLDNAMSKAGFQKVQVEKQDKRAKKMGETLDQVKKNYFKPGNTDLIAKEKLDAGTHFKAFLKAQKDFETARDEQSLNHLEAMAKAYQAHFSKDFGPKDQKKKENVRKLSICGTALKMASHYRLALEQDKLGKPPWDEEKTMRSAEIYSKMIFEEDDKMATPNDPGAGVNGAFWIEKTVWGDKPQDTDLKKTFIFKPIDAESLVQGYPKGGSAAREMLGKSIGDQLQAQMGLNFDVPETTVIAVDSSKLPDEHKQPGPIGVPRIGSIQHFEKSKGELKKLVQKDRSILNTIPDEEVEKMAVLDFIQLNTDRHDGNFMVGERDDGKGGQTPRLVPIDNGLCMPSMEGLRGRRGKLVPPHACLGLTPGAQKKMSPETVSKIQAIDPDEVVAGMKKSFEAMKKLHPDAANASEISDANFELTKRSIMFLKKASTELTIAEIQDAYLSSLEEIFDSAPDKMDAGFDKAIQNVKDRKQGLQELAVHKDRMPELYVEMQALGWGIGVSNQAFDSWAQLNPSKVMEIYKNKTVNPKAVQELADLRKVLKGHPDENKTLGKGLAQDILTLQGPANGLKYKKALLYGEEKATKVASERADIFEELGGDAKAKQLDLDKKAKTLEDKVKLMVQAPIILLGGDQEIAKLKKLYPQTALKTPEQQYRALKAWKEYQALGGDVAFYRAGGGVENLVLGERLVELKDMNAIHEV